MKNFTFFDHNTLMNNVLKYFNAIFITWILSIIIVSNNKTLCGMLMILPLIILFTIFIIYLLGFFDYDVIIEQKFYWSTWEGIEIETAQYCKYKKFNKYFIINDSNSKWFYPENHDDYFEFLEKIRILEKEIVYIDNETFQIENTNSKIRKA